MFGLLLLSAVALSPGGKEITFQSGKDFVKAYLATPEGEGKHPGIVMVHEWWGLNDQIKSTADKLSKEGYVVIVPDLYRGKVGKDAESAHELMRGLPDERALGDIKAAADYLEKEPRLTSKDFGIVGFCMGGRFSLLSGIDDSRFKATVICYGRPETSPEKLKKLSGPVLGIFGAADQGIGQDQLDAFGKGMKEAGKTIELKAFEGAGHAFMNEQNRGYNEKAAQEAWTMILGFFKKNLGQKQHM